MGDIIKRHEKQYQRQSIKLSPKVVKGTLQSLFIINIKINKESNRGSIVTLGSLLNHVVRWLSDRVEHNTIAKNHTILILEARRAALSKAPYLCITVGRQVVANRQYLQSCYQWMELT